MITIQLDKIAAIRVAGIKVIVPPNEVSQIKKIQVKSKDANGAQPKDRITLQEKVPESKLENLLQTVPNVIAKEIDVIITKKPTGNLNIKLEIKACFHQKQTTATTLASTSTRE